MHKPTSILLRGKFLINHKYFKKYKAMINTNYNHTFICINNHHKGAFSLHQWWLESSEGINVSEEIHKAFVSCLVLWNIMISFIWFSLHHTVIPFLWFMID